MTVSTAGPIRGFIGRWMMRFEASQQIILLAFQGTTAVSALSGVLAYTGHQGAVPYVLAAGAAFLTAFAYAYTELGVYNRKNREKEERGRNFAQPAMRIDDEMIGVAVFAAVHGRPPDRDDIEAIAEAVDDRYRAHRNGVNVE